MTAPAVSPWTVVSSRRVQLVDASCAGCDWSRPPTSGQGWLATRAAAQRHALSTGHSTTVAVGSTFLYRRFGRAPRRGPRP